MRNMSFSLTTQQCREMTKDVTRRLGWAILKPGDPLTKGRMSTTSTEERSSSKLLFSTS